MATYCLIIKLDNDSIISVGKLGELNFKKGYYIYVGSALNSIDGRIKRHLKTEKKIFWHVDYLLATPNSYIESVLLERSPEKWECNVASEISVEGSPVNKFGCSDCKCNSHLFYFKSLEEAEECILSAFNKLELNTEKFKD
jgi:Uri superfamily endonuclease